MSLDVMPLSTTAYLADTQHLTLQQHGAYFLILMSMWRSDGWIVDDERMLARICKTNLTGWRKLAPIVRSLLISRDGKLTQKRLLSEAEKKLDETQKRILAGSLGGKAKSMKSKESVVASASVLLDSSDSVSLSLRESKIDSRSSSKGERSRFSAASTCQPVHALWQPSDPGLRYAVSKGFAGDKLESMIKNFVRWHRKNGKLLADTEPAWESWVDREVTFDQQDKQRNGGENGSRGSRTLQDDRLSVGKAAQRLAEQIGENGQFPPRPRLVSDESETDRRLLSTR